jgi:Domain of unknown function (DUF3470)
LAGITEVKEALSDHEQSDGVLDKLSYLEMWRAKIGWCFVRRAQIDAGVFLL